MRPRLLCGNWKMNLDRAGARTIAANLRAGVNSILQTEGLDLVLFPPFPYLEAVGKLLEGSCVKLGAQNLHQAERGAHTGEVAASMLVDLGCEFVIVGHSERRHGLGEDDALVGHKAKTALTAGLVPIVCIGETGAERDANETFKVLERQLAAVVDVLGPSEALSTCVIAYEPVWAIGTGRVATPDEAQAVHRHVRSFLGVVGESMPLLYGGSLNGDNAPSLFAQADVDGGLVGGASLKAEEFSRILLSLGDAGSD